MITKRVDEGLGLSRIIRTKRVTNVRTDKSSASVKVPAARLASNPLIASSLR